MLEWVGVDERIWEKDGLHKRAFMAQMEQEGLVVAEPERWEAFPKEKGIVIAADRELYERMVAVKLAVIWYWDGGEVPDGAKYLLQELEGADKRYLELVHHRFHGMPLTIARGSGWVLREAVQEDEQAVWEGYQACPQAYAEAVSQHKEERKRYLQAYAEGMYQLYGYGMWLAIQEETGRMIGRAGLEPVLSEDTQAGSCLNRLVDEAYCLQAGYMVMPQFQNQGYGTAFLQEIVTYGYEQAGAGKIVALIRRDNELSAKLARRAGFVCLEETMYRGCHVMVYVHNR